MRYRACRGRFGERHMVREEPLVSLKDVTCKAGESVLLENLDLIAAAGECVLLCGASGSGKTTVTKCVNGLIPAFELGITRSGSVSVASCEPAACEMYELSAVTGSVFQNPKSQFYYSTSNDELAFGLERAGVDAEVIERRVSRTISELGVGRLLGRSVQKMSGGEKQSLAFASVAVFDPAVYVLDEPTANLDDAGVAALRSHIAHVLTQGSTVLVAEHRLAFLEGLVTRALVLEGGRVARMLSGGDLASLEKSQRARLGLRATRESDIPALQVGEAVSHGARCLDSGLSVRGFAVARKGRLLFDPISIDAPRGTVTGIVGANGVGKSTLLRALSGLASSSLGTVHLDGESLPTRRRRKRCALVMQDVNHQLFGDSVQSECELSCASMERGLRASRIEEVLGRLDLIDVVERHPLSLSGGQKQRLAVACADLSHRDIILLDEPTSGLDLGHMAELVRLLRELALRGRVIMVATHDREFLSICCDQVFRLAPSAEGRG